jgi:hypothetical protein
VAMVNVASTPWCLQLLLLVSQLRQHRKYSESWSPRIWMEVLALELGSWNLLKRVLVSWCEEKYKDCEEDKAPD